MSRRLTGNKYGRLTVIEDSGKRSKCRHIIWECICNCGNKCKLTTGQLQSGSTQSCGCLKKEVDKKNGFVRGKLNIKHSMCGTREYITWINMKTRCYNSKEESYKNWGGRGIFVCRRWRNSFENFYKDMGDKPEGLSIDRINNNGPYGPWNCRWSTAKEQIHNNRRICN